MEITIVQWNKLIYLTICIFLLSQGCYSNHAKYKHLSLDKNEILVDKIVSLETGSVERDHKIVKITTTELGQGHNGDEAEVNKGQESNLDLLELMKEMQAEIKELKSAKESDRYVYLVY
jgi:hypothetical protein